MAGGGDPRRMWNNYFGTRSREPQVSLRSPKVVSVPVRFVCSDPRRSNAAVTIQKIFRAFVVRKSVSKIFSVKREVDDVERTLSLPETFEKLRRDEKERLRLNETLMRLLFRLDSVRGVDSGVRDCRKFVIRKAISLQERIDAIASSSAFFNSENADLEVSELEFREEFESKEPEKDCSVQEKDEVEPMLEMTDSQDPKIEADSKSESESSSEAKEEVEEKEEIENLESNEDSSDSESEYESSAEMAKEEDLEMRNKEGRRREELIEKMLEDNEKLMGMMADLHERSEAQTRLLSCLSQRVEQLERAFLCDRHRKKKKQRRTAKPTL